MTERFRANATVALLVLLALVPVRGLFTLTRVFFVRDLGFFFWSRHLWLRHTIFGGELPLWNPYSGGGQAAYADALNQIFMPVTLALRLLPSDVLSFNLWVAMPIPIAIVGTFLFLRRHHALASAAIGAFAFALSGTLVSSLNSPNLSWSLAWLPWLCRAVDRLVERPERATAAALAVVIALQALCGEPVTLAASMLLIVVQAISAASLRHEARWTPLSWMVGAIALGGALSAAQMLPTTVAGIEAGRAAWSDTPDFWSLHPLAAVEAVVPHLFGNYYTSFLADMPWMTALNSGREPFFYSLYVGPLVVLMACAGIAAYPRRCTPWLLLLVLFGVAAMGHYTPVYPAGRRLIAPLAFFRFPVKYVAVAFFALAVMVAYGGDAVFAEDGSARRVRRVAVVSAAIAVASGLVLALALAAPPFALHAARAFAVRIQLSDPLAGATFLLSVGEPLVARSTGLLLAGATLLALAADSQQRRRRFAWALLLTLSVGDLLFASASLNPTIALAKLAPPGWYVRLAGPDRIYVGGRVRGFMDAEDIDGSPGWELPPEPTAIGGRAVLNAELPMEPSGWKVREALSYDLPVLMPATYGRVVRRFVEAPAGERDAFLRRSGVRWCVVPEDRPEGDIAAAVPDWHMIVIVCNPSAARAFITSTVESGADTKAQEDTLFDPRLPDDILRLDTALPPPAEGRPAAPASTRAVALTRDSANAVDLAASLPQDGFVVLRDAYDPGWHAFVDDAEVPVVRANALYRAVHVRAGRHVIRFVYRPRTLGIGLILSGTAIVLCVLLFLPKRPRSDVRRRSGQAAGFTLIELMVVMALIGILLAIAFARYEGMRARANETSAASSLQTIAAAQWTFALTCGHEKYATTLPSLAQPIPSTGQAFLSPDLTGAEQVEHSGYLFQMTATPLDGALPSCNGVPVAAGYAVTADPVKPGVSGTRFLAVNADRVVYVDEKQTFQGNMPETGAPDHGAELHP